MERNGDRSAESEERPLPKDIFMVTRFSESDSGGIPVTIETLTSQWKNRVKGVHLLRSEKIGPIIRDYSATDSIIILHHLDLNSVQTFMELDEEWRKRCRVILYQNIDKNSIIRNSKLRAGKDLSTQALSIIDQGVEARRQICHFPGVQTYAISKDIFENTVNAQMAPADRLHKIHIPIQNAHLGNVDEQFIEQKRLGYEIQLLCVSRLEPEKGVSDIFTLQSELSKLMPNKILIIEVVGQASNQVFGSQLIREAETRNGILSTRVNFSGYKSTPELIEIYRSSSLLISPSQIDTWGLTLVEGMAYGLPVLALFSPGGREIFDDIPLVCGYIEKDMQALSKKVQEIVENDGLYTKYSQNALINANLFSPEKVAEEILASL